MKAAFVIMSILGCNDAGTQCVPVASVADEWQTVKACDSASEKILTKYQNAPHPVVVAVCQTAETTALADSESDVSEAQDLLGGKMDIPVPPLVSQENNQGMASRAIALFRHALPGKQSIQLTLEKPLHFATDTYSWVARKIRD
jgi:hypothetical protein